MKKNRIVLIFILTIFQLHSFAQFVADKKTENGYEYEYVQADPLNTRIYTLKNGLKLYLSVYKNAPRIQTFIPVKAGSKNDPATATGLAHYLEHILFKGTSKIGTSNWKAEEAELQKIEALYEYYRKTTDEEQRKKMYKLIDSISIGASKFAIANEYDKLMSTIGADGTNAYTFFEQTVYVNDIPSNQLEKWLEIEAERFHEVVPRLFHTELEAVYEEKNKGLDQDRRKVWEVMMEGLFQKHTYGTQTTIGTIEHLKNPSITEIKKYFNTYYVPNNMAICMSGDLDYTQTVKWAEKYFGSYTPKEIPTYTSPTENPITAPVVKEVLGPDAENITIAFRGAGINNRNTNNTKDIYYLKLLSMLLNNGQAGLIDINLNQKQKILGGYAYDLPLNDYSIFVLSGKPRDGQSLDEVKNLLLAQLDSVKNGKFEDWLLQAIINDYKTTKMQEYESNRSRAEALVDAFTSSTPWNLYISEIPSLEKITKQELIDYVKLNFSNNFVVVYKKKGTDSSIRKVPKPQISPVELNRDKQSDFFTNITSKKAPSIEPVYVDFAKDLTVESFKNSPDFAYKKNTENGLFYLNFVWEVNGSIDYKYALASRYFNYLGTDKMSSEILKKEFFKLGCSFSIGAGLDEIRISLSGLQENESKALRLLESLLNNAQANDLALKNLINDILKQRTDAKLNKDVILKSALGNFVKYGADNPYKNIIPKSELEKITSSELISFIKKLKGFKHRITYYGPTGYEDLKKLISAEHRAPGEFSFLKSVKEFPYAETNKNVVYFVNYEMVQAEIIMLSKSIKYTPEIIPEVKMYNEYFGGSMGSVVFQELRESKALAYSVSSRHSADSKRNSYYWTQSYIGTQADKIIDAIDGLNNLLNDMPKSDALFQTSQQSVLESIRTTRTNKYGVISMWEEYQRLGLTSDINKAIYEKGLKISFDDIAAFHKKYISNKPKAYLVIGSKDKIDFKQLKKYGEIVEMKMEDIFGY